MSITWCPLAVAATAENIFADLKLWLVQIIIVSVRPSCMSNRISNSSNQMRKPLQSLTWSIFSISSAICIYRNPGRKAKCRNEINSHADSKRPNIFVACILMNSKCTFCLQKLDPLVEPASLNERITFYISSTRSIREVCASLSMRGCPEPNASTLDSSARKKRRKRVFGGKETYTKVQQCQCTE